MAVGVLRLDTETKFSMTGMVGLHTLLISEREGFNGESQAMENPLPSNDAKMMGDVDLHYIVRYFILFFLRHSCIYEHVFAPTLESQDVSEHTGYGSLCLFRTQYMDFCRHRSRVGQITYKMSR